MAVGTGTHGVDAVNGTKVANGTNGTNDTNGTNGTNGANGHPAVDVSVAISPNDIEAVPQLIKEIQSTSNSLAEGGDEARHALLLKARTLVQALETPRETMVKHCWAQTGAMAGLQLGVDTGLWRLMAQKGDRPQPVQELADELGIEFSLLARLMRHLGAMGYIKEAGVDAYQPTNYSKAMSIDIIGEGYLPMLAGASAGTTQFHEFARLNNWRTPTDSKKTGIQHAYKTDMDFFARQHAIGYGSHFNKHMGGYRQGRVPWMKLMPVQERLIQGADASPDAPFLVDVGGSIGHDLAEFRRHFPEHPGRLIVQDVPAVIEQIGDGLDPEIQRMTVDFFREQPVAGARAYYMHSCLHDWPDQDCATILSKIREAMKPGYSKLLINENVIPSRGAWFETTALDMVMLTLFSSRERTFDDWQTLLAGSGLKIVHIWEGGKGVEGLIECELA